MPAGHKWYKPFSAFSHATRLAAIILHNALKPAISKSKITSVMKCVEFVCTGRLKTHHQYPLEQPRIVRSNKWLWQFKLSLMGKMGIMGVGRVLGLVNIVSKHCCPGVLNPPKLVVSVGYENGDTSERKTRQNWWRVAKKYEDRNGGQFRSVEVSLGPLVSLSRVSRDEVIFSALRKDVFPFTHSLVFFSPDS